MGKPKTVEEIKALKEQTKKRLDELRTNAELCLTNLDTLRTRIRNATQNTGPEGALGSDLKEFYEKTKDNVSDIKNAADALSLEAPTAQAIKKLETAVDRALKDYAAHNAHLDALARDVRDEKDSTKREMVFIAKQGGLKVGRMLSDLGKSATRFITSCLKSTKEETARIQEIHKKETAGVEGAARTVGGAIGTGVRATGRAAGELGTALNETASDAKALLEDATPESAKRAGRAVKTKAGEAYTKVKGKVAGALSAETKATLESASNTVSSGFSAVSHAVSNVVSSVPSIPPVAPVLPALKDAAKNLQATISQHDAGITQSLRDLEALRFPKPQLIVNVPKTPPPPRPKNPTAEGIRKKRQGPRSSSQSEY